MPYWDLSFPAAFKTYLEHVSVCELTFHYTEDARCEGICKAKRITYITTCGGFVEGANFGYEYIVGIAKMFGIPEVRFVAAEGLDIVGIDIQEQMDKARAQMAKLD
ncbi:MAG: NAD(P)H-dependent oxidoreductase [Eggerthella lenta]